MLDGGSRCNCAEKQSPLRDDPARYYYATFASNLAGVLGSVLAALGIERLLGPPRRWSAVTLWRWTAATLWPCPGRALPSFARQDLRVPLCNYGHVWI